ncbi:MAG TPA: prenyltransferase/squalene oxidase repeat-containing protein [Pirellulales bacterium]|jgi:hypothetical protein|nr:prenyltransferase/squalene oxidase repeat-containing protein [Pirellulales bacterium]
MVDPRNASSSGRLAALALLCAAVAAPPPPALAEEPVRPLHVSAAKPRPFPATEPAAIEAALHRGIAFLVQDQNRDGSWGTAGRTKDLNIYAPGDAHQGYRAAVTALCVLALLETGDHAAETSSAIDRGETWLLDHLGSLRRSSPDVLYNIWGHCYGIQALAKMCEAKPDDHDRQKRIRDLIVQQIDLLHRYEAVNGGWGYYDFEFQTQQPAADTASFMSAAVLVALKKAQQIGVEVPRKVVDRAIASIHRQQKPDLSYLYGEYMWYAPAAPINLPGSSLGRTQSCNVALRLWDDRRITDEILATCLDRLFDRNIWLDIGRKRPIPHESFFAVAGYFYYFGHYYAALAIELLPADQRPPQQQQLAYRLLDLQEKDGSWWDYPLYNYHQQYGTAFALMSLVRCLPVK